MIAVLSPAKSLDYDRAYPALAATTPRFAEEAATLAHAAARLSKTRLRELMHISEPLAKLNMDRFRSFDTLPERPAIHAFDGDVYTGFDVETLPDEAVVFAQDHLRILSGLYGLLCPLDLMRPYRLEMGTRWAPRRKKLTDWWGPRIADLLASDVVAEGSGIVLNLASQEYWAAVADRLPPTVRVVHVEFHDDGKTVAFHAKRARGMMARYLVEHRIDTLDGMRDFDSAGYCFDAGASDDTRLRFAR